MCLSDGSKSKREYGRKKNFCDQLIRYLHAKVKCQCPLQLLRKYLFEAKTYFRKPGEIIVLLIDTDQILTEKTIHKSNNNQYEAPCQTTKKLKSPLHYLEQK